MRPRQQGLVVVLLLCAATLAATTSAIWQAKDPREWTEREARSILTDSPWAKQMPMPAGGRPGVVVLEPGSNGAPPPSAALGNPSSSTTGPNMTNSGYPGATGPADTNGTHTLPTTARPSGVSEPTGAPISQAPLTVIWASAAPVRLAVLKLRSPHEPITDAQVANATKPRESYVVAVIGLPPPAEADADPKELSKNAFLSVKGKAPAKAFDSDYRRIGNADVYFFRFHRASLPVAADDQQIEFKMTMDKIAVKRKFELKDMQYQGQLAL